MTLITRVLSPLRKDVDKLGARRHKLASLHASYQFAGSKKPPECHDTEAEETDLCSYSLQLRLHYVNFVICVNFRGARSRAREIVSVISPSPSSLPLSLSHSSSLIDVQGEFFMKNSTRARTRINARCRNLGQLERFGSLCDAPLHEEARIPDWRYEDGIIVIEVTTIRSRGSKEFPRYSTAT